MTRVMRISVVFGLVFTGLAMADETPAEIRAWEAFSEEVRRIGTELLGEHRQPYDSDRAEGLLYLAQQLATSVRAVIAERDAGLPLLRLGATNIEKWGLDGADAKYTGAALDSAGIYRLSGRLGSARLPAIQVARDHPDFAAFDSLSGADFGADAEGRFSIVIARERPDDWQGPWLRLEPGANRLLVREYFNDWSVERPSRMWLERLDDTPAPVPPDLDTAAQVLETVAARFAGRSAMWIPWITRTQTSLENRLEQLGPTGQGLVNNVYGEGWFRLAPEQALVIELEAPDAELWSFQLGNFWWESLDYFHRTGSLNGHQAVAGIDGRYRLVVAHRDPGVPNWLDTGGRSQGAIMYRFQNSRNAPLPVAQVVPLAALADVLPADTPQVTAEQRRAEIRERRAHAHQRWAP